MVLVVIAWISTRFTIAVVAIAVVPTGTALAVRVEWSICIGWKLSSGLISMKAVVLLVKRKAVADGCPSMQKSGCHWI